jgi:transposase InsO family protein
MNWFLPLVELIKIRKEKFMLNEKTIQAIGLFKFSLIAPVINDTYNAPSKEQFYRDVASKSHKHPSGEKVKYASGTIKRWHMKYNKDGFEGLLPKQRSDAGLPRSFDEKTIDEINNIKEKFPHITTKMIYQKLIEDGYIKESEVSLSSLYRYIRDNNLKRSQLEGVERKAFEMENVNDCWQADTSHLLRLNIDGKLKKTYLVAILDDKSRLIVHAEIFFNDNAINFQIALKKAIKKFGVPKRVFVDNGGPFKNKQIKLICASLGIHLIQSRPYSPKSKGKIERVFRTVKDNFVHCTDWDQFNSLEELNESFNVYLNEKYQNEIHSVTKKSPREIYKESLDLIKYKPAEAIDKAFLNRISRTVRTDATITLNTTFYEVPQKYIRRRIKLRYLPDDLSKLFIINQNNEIMETVYPLKKVDNSKIKRKAIDYSEIGGRVNV